MPMLCTAPRVLKLSDLSLKFPVSGTCFGDVVASSRRAAGYWRSLRTQAARRVSSIEIAKQDASATKSLLWPAVVYGSEPILAHLTRQMNGNSAEFLKSEAACFDGSTLISADRWSALFDFRHDTSYRLCNLAPEHLLARAQARAERFLAEVWPEAFQEFCAMIKGVAWFESSTIKNFSDPKTFGMIFFNMENGCDPYRLIEEIVHECAHHALFIETATDPLLVDPKRDMFSPIRQEMRPAIGVYHGSFAMGRILELARRLQALGTPEASLASERIVEKYLTKQRVALSELKKLKLTPQGLSCLLEMEAHAGGN